MTRYEEICAKIQRRSEGVVKGSLGYCEEPLVSTDFKTSPISSIFGFEAGIMLDPTFVKVMAWCGNARSDSCHVVHLFKRMASVDTCMKLRTRGSWWSWTPW